MRKILVAGNWKMHGSSSMVTSLLDALLAAPRSESIDLAVFPPFPVPILQEDTRLMLELMRLMFPYLLTLLVLASNRWRCCR